LIARRTITIALSALGLLATILAVTAVAEARPPRLLAESPHRFAVRPAVIDYTGDATAFLGGRDAGTYDFGHLHWSYWTRYRAYATGVDWINNCDPSCADGYFYAHPARVLATRVRHGKFTRLKIRYRYGSRALTDRRALRGIGHGRWIWDTI
jgi:hypothetical protein